MKPLAVREVLLSHQLKVFTALDFARITGLPPRRTRYFLEEQTKQGLLVRLLRGLYALATDLPDETMIANRLYTPSYLSFEYALAYYHVIPELPYIVTSATTKTTRMFIVEGKSYQYLSLKTEAYTGFRIEKCPGEEQMLIAEPEKALADYLYFVALGKKNVSERLNVIGLDRGKLLGYAALFHRPRVINLINEYVV